MAGVGDCTCGRGVSSVTVAPSTMSDRQSQVEAMVGDDKAVSMLELAAATVSRQLCET